MIVAGLEWNKLLLAIDPDTTRFIKAALLLSIQ